MLTIINIKIKKYLEKRRKEVQQNQDQELINIIKNMV